MHCTPSHFLSTYLPNPLLTTPTITLATPTIPLALPTIPLAPPTCIIDQNVDSSEEFESFLRSCPGLLRFAEIYRQNPRNHQTVKKSEVYTYILPYISMSQSNRTNPQIQHFPKLIAQHALLLECAAKPCPLI